MADILTSARFAENANAPSGATTREQILAHASCYDWFSADADNVDYGTEPAIASIVSLKSGSTRTLAQATGSLQPALTADAIASTPPYAAAKFDGADDRMLYASPPPLTSAFSFVTLFSPDVTTANKQVFGAFDGVGDSCYLGMNGSSQIAYSFGTAGLCTFSDVTVEAGAAYLAITSFNGSDTARARLMKVGSNLRPRSKEAATTATTISAGFYLGALNSAGAQPFDGAVAEFIPFTLDLLDPASDTAADLLEIVLKYFHGVYGVRV